MPNDWRGRGVHGANWGEMRGADEAEHGAGGNGPLRQGQTRTLSLDRVAVLVKRPWESLSSIWAVPRERKRQMDQAGVERAQRWGQGGRQSGKPL